jgi:hypothetical protein
MVAPKKNSPTQKKEKKKVGSEKGKKEKDAGGKIKELKIELLKNPTKRKSIKREIARLLTLRTNSAGGGK